MIFSPWDYVARMQPCRIENFLTWATEYVLRYHKISLQVRGHWRGFLIPQYPKSRGGLRCGSPSFDSLVLQSEDFLGGGSTKKHRENVQQIAMVFSQVGPGLISCATVADAIYQTLITVWYHCYLEFLCRLGIVKTCFPYISPS